MVTGRIEGGRGWGVGARALATIDNSDDTISSLMFQ